MQAPRERNSNAGSGKTDSKNQQRAHQDDHIASLAVDAEPRLALVGAVPNVKVAAAGYEKRNGVSNECPEKRWGVQFVLATAM
jgi:hypothetical protein